MQLMQTLRRNETIVALSVGAAASLLTFGTFAPLWVVGLAGVGGFLGTKAIL